MMRKILTRIKFIIFCLKITKNPIIIFKFILLKLFNKINQDLANNLAKKMLKPIKVSTEFGEIIIPGTYSSFVVIHPSYERKVREYIHNFTKNVDPSKDIFIVVGAHVGRYVIEFSKYFDKILAFEPNPYVFEILKKNVELNKISDKVTLFNIALSNKNGEIPFKLDNITETECKVTNNNHKNIIYVKCKKFDDLNIYINPTNVKLIIIDVEGHEYNVLKGMTSLLKNLSDDCKIIIEILESSKNKDKVKELLNKYGYKLKQIEGGNYLAYK